MYDDGKQYELSNAELRWLQVRSDSYFREYQTLYDSQTALKLAKDQAWEELVQFKEGKQDTESTELFKSQLNDIKQAAFQEGFARRTTRPVEQPTPDITGLPTTPIGESFNQFDRGWKDPIEVVQGWFENNRQMYAGGQQERAAGFAFSAGMPGYTGFQTDKAVYQFQNEPTHVAAQFLWNLYKEASLTIGPAIQKYIERKTGTNVYPDWADDPQTLATRIASGVGGTLGFLTPSGLSIVRTGSKLVRGGIELGAKAAGKVLVKEASETLAREALELVPKEVAEKAGTAKLLEIARFSMRSGFGAKERELGTGIGGALSWMRRGAQGEKAARIFSEELPKIVSNSAMSSAKDISMMLGREAPQELIEAIGKVATKIPTTQAFSTLASLSETGIGRFGLSMAEHAAAGGVGLALQGMATTTATLASEGVPTPVIFEEAGKQAVHGLATGGLFAAFGAIPNVKSLDSAGSASRLLYKTLGFTEPDVKKYLSRMKSIAGDLEKDGFSYKTFSRAVKRGMSHKEMLDTPDGARRLAAQKALYRETFNSPELSYLKGRFKTIESANLIEAQLPKLAEELDSAKSIMRMNYLWKAVPREAANHFLAAAPRMFTAATVMNWKEIFQDRELVKRHPEDFIMSFLMTMYFTKDPAVPYEARLKYGEESRQWKDPTINRVQFLLSRSGEFFPDLYRNTEFGTWVDEYQRGYASLKDISQTKLGKEVHLFAQEAIKNAQMPEPASAGFFTGETNKQVRTRLQVELQPIQAEISSLERHKQTPETAKRLETLTTKQARLRAQLEGSESETYFTSEDVLQMRIAQHGDKIIRLIDTINQMAGPSYTSGGKRLIRAEELTDMQRNALAEAFKERYKQDEFDPDALRNELSEVMRNDTVKAKSVMEGYIEDVRAAHPATMYRGPLEIDLGGVMDKLDPNNPNDLALMDQVRAYNTYRQMYVRTSGKYNRETARYTEELIKEAREKGNTEAQVGELIPERWIVKPEQLIELKATMKEKFDLASKAFGEFLGLGEGGNSKFGDTRTIAWLQNRLIAGHVDQVFDLFNKEGFIWSVPEAMDIGRGDRARKMRQVKREDLYRLIAEGGVISGDVVKYLSRLPDYAEVKDALSNWDGLDKAGDHYLTKEGKWDLARSFFDTLPFVSKDYVFHKDPTKYVKREFTPQEARALNEFASLLYHSGIGHGPGYSDMIREEGLRRRYSKTNDKQRAFLSAMQAVGKWDWETGELTVPMLYNVIDREGHEIREELPLDQMYVKVNKHWGEWAKPMNEMLNSLIQDGAVKRLIFTNEPSVVTGKESGLTPGSYLNPEVLSTIFKIVGGEGRESLSVDKILSNVMKRIKLADVKDQKIADAVYKEFGALVMKHTIKSQTKLLTFLQEHGVITGLDAEGNFQIEKIEKLFDAKVREGLSAMSIGETGFSAESLKEKIDREVEDRIRDIGIDRLTEDREIDRISPIKFFAKADLSEENLTALYSDIRNEVITSGVELRYKAYYLADGNGKAQDYFAELDQKPGAGVQDWQAVYCYIKDQRTIDMFSIRSAPVLTIENGQPVWKQNGGIEIKNSIVRGGRFIDRMREDGLDFARLDGKIESGVQRKGKKQWLTQASMDLFEDAEIAQGELDSILELSNTPGKVPFGLFRGKGKQARDRAVASRAWGGTVVPLGFGHEESRLLVKMPRTPEEYDLFKKKFVELSDHLRGLEKEMQGEIDSGARRWDAYPKNDLHRIFAAVETMRKIIDARVPEFMTDGFAGLGIPNDALSRAVHTFVMMKRYGIGYFDQYKEAVAQRLFDGNDVEYKKLRKAVYKYSKNFSNLDATGLDEASWDRYRMTVNDDPTLRGPNLAEGKKFRYMVVDDGAEPWKFNNSEYFNGMISMSQRVAAIISLVQGYHGPHYLVKGFFNSEGVGTILSKNSFQTIELHQELLEKYGVDFFIPLSTLKYLPAEMRENMLQVDHLHGRELIDPEKYVHEIGVKDFNVIQVERNGSRSAPLTTGMELYISEKGLDYFKGQFADGERGNGQGKTGFQRFNALLSVMADAREGDLAAARVTNKLFRFFYDQSMETGNGNLDGFDSTHRDWIYSSEDANPMSLPFREKSFNFLKSRVLDTDVFSIHSDHGRMGVLQAPFWDMAARPVQLVGPEGDQSQVLSADGKDWVGSMGTAVGSYYDQDLPIHANTQAAYRTDMGWVKRSIKTDFFRSFIRDMNSKITYSKTFKDILKLNNVDMSNPEAIGDFLTKFALGMDPKGIRTRTTPNTEGRFFEVLDWLFDGGNVSFDYSIGHNGRQGIDVGIVSMWQRQPTIKANDTIAAVKMGLLSEMHGNAYILNRTDAVRKAEADWDWDEISCFNDMTPDLINQLIKRGKDPSQFPEMPGEIPMDLDITNAYSGGKAPSDWVKFQNNSYLANRGIGQAQVLNQIVSQIVSADERIGPFIDPHMREGDPGRVYWIAGRHRNYDDMVKAGEGKAPKDQPHLRVASAVQAFTDSAGKMMPQEWLDGTWKDRIVEDLFAMYYPKKDNPSEPDFSNPVSIRTDDAVRKDLVETWFEPKARLARTIKKKNKSMKMDDIFRNIRGWHMGQYGYTGDPEHAPRDGYNAVNVGFLNSLNSREPWSRAKTVVAIDHVLAAIGASPEEIKKLHKQLPLDKEEGEYTLKQFMERLRQYAAQSKSLITRGNENYFSTREAVGHQLFESTKLWSESKNSDMDAEQLSGIKQFVQLYSPIAGLPSQTTFKELVNRYYKFYEGEVTMDRKKAYETMAALRAEMQENAESGDKYADRKNRDLRARLSGLSKYVKSKEALRSARRKDWDEQFLMNNDKKKYVSDDEVIRRMRHHAVVNTLLAGMANDPDYPTISKEARRIRSIHRQHWRDSGDKGTGKITASLRPGMEPEILPMTTETINQAERNLVQEYYEKWSTRGKGDLAVLLLPYDPPNEILGTIKVGGGRTPVGPKVIVPVYNNPFNGGWSFMSKTLAAQLAATERSLNSMISGEGISSMVSTWKNHLGGWANVIGHGANRWNTYARNDYYASIGQMANKDVELEGQFGRPGRSPNMYVYPPGSVVTVVLGPREMASMSAENFIDMLVKNDQHPYVYPVAVSMVQRINEMGGVLDLTGLDLGDPLKMVASFTLKRYSKGLPEHHWQDIQLMSKWARSGRGMQSSTSSRLIDMNLATPGGGSQEPRTRPPRPPEEGGTPAVEVGPVGPTGGASGGAGPVDMGGVRETGEIQAVREAYGRLRADMESNEELPGYWGQSLNFQSWACGVLKKDVVNQPLTVKDVRTLKMEWQAEKARMQRAQKGFKGALGAFKLRYFAFNALMDADKDMAPLARWFAHMKFTMANGEAEYTYKAHKISDKLNEILQIRGFGQSITKEALKMGEVQMRIQGLSRQIEEFGRKGESENSPLIRTLITKRRTLEQKLRGMQSDSPVYTAMSDVMNLAQHVKATNNKGVVATWVDTNGQAIEAKDVTSLKRLFDEVLGPDVKEIERTALVDAAVKTHEYFRGLRQVLDDTMPIFRDVIKMKYGGTLPEDAFNELVDSINLGFVTGYVPRYDPTFLASWQNLSDRADMTNDPSLLFGSLKSNIAEYGPRSVTPVKHRYQGSDWSRNLPLTLQRYQQDVYTFAYKNRMEFEMMKAQGKLTERFMATSDAKFKPFLKALSTYIDEWNRDVMLADPKSKDAFTKFSQYVRGVQIFSKMGFRASSAMRNLPQLTALYAAKGKGLMSEAQKAYNHDKDFRDYCGIPAGGGGLSDLAGYSDQERLRQLSGYETGAGEKVQNFMNRVNSRSLWFLQNMPVLGEHALRGKADIVAKWEVYNNVFLNSDRRQQFIDRNFSEDMLTAIPELSQYLGKNAMGRLVKQKEWESIANDQWFRYCNELGSRAASDLNEHINYEYSMGSRPAAFRTPMGAMLYQLKFYTVQNAQMWTNIVRDAHYSKEISDGMAEWVHTPEFRTALTLGMFTTLMSVSPLMVPYGLGTMFRPDWIDVLGKGNQALQALTSEDEAAINRVFYGKGALQYLFGPTASELTNFLNMMFANDIGNPSNEVKVLLGLRDMRDLGTQKIVHKVSRAFLPTAIVDAIAYDAPKLVKSDAKAWPEVIADFLGFRYQYDEGQTAKKLTDWMEGNLPGLAQAR